MYKNNKLAFDILEFTLQYVTLIDYYIVKDTFKMASNDNTIKVEIKANE